MILTEEVEKYLCYCKLQKELDDKTIKAYRTDFQQFVQMVGEALINKEVLNKHFLHLNCT